VTVHLAVPFLIGLNGAAVTLAQDSAEEVAQSVKVLLSTRPGDRAVVPGYGVPEPTFAPTADPVDAALVIAAAAEWEPRADPEVITRIVSESEAQVTFR
jgi:phage baseplate assembly protein W